jgi:hypothetical protein
MPAPRTPRIRARLERTLLGVFMSVVARLLERRLVKRRAR